VLFEALVVKVLLAFRAVEKLDSVQVRLVLTNLTRLNFTLLANEVLSLSGEHLG